MGAGKSRGSVPTKTESAPMPPAEEPTTTNSLPSCAACSSVLIYGLILRAWLSRLDQFRRVRLFGLRLVARAQDELAQRVGLLLRRARLLFKAARGPLEVALARARGHAARERHLLFERAHGRPKRRFERLGLLGHEAVGGEGVADVAAEAQQVAFAQLPERAVAFGARDGRDFPDALDGLEQLLRVHLLLGDLVLGLQIFVHLEHSFRRRLAA